MSGQLAEICYHASPVADLEKLGLSPWAKPLVTRNVSGWIYLGSKDYILDQYLKYAPKGVYYLYKVDISGLKMDEAYLVGSQKRYGEHIPGYKLRRICSVNTRGH